MQRFILGSLHSPADEVMGEIEAIAGALYEKPDSVFAAGKTVIIPAELALTPERMRETYGHLLSSDLFEDYAIGTICGSAYGASQTDEIVRIAGRRFIYGEGGRVFVDISRDGYDDWMELGEATGEVPETIERVVEVESEDEDEPERVTVTNRFRERIEDAQFYSEGLRQWTVRTRASGPVVLAPGPAKLLVVVTRGDFDAIEGPRLDKALGPNARAIMKRNPVAVFAVRCEGRLERLYRRVAHCIPPNLVEDFIVLNLGEDAAGMRPGLCPLADWLEKPPEVDPETLFNLPRRWRTHHRG